MSTFNRILVYSMGFIFGHIASGYGALFMTLFFIVVFDIGMKFIGKAWKIPFTREDPNRFN